MGLAGKGGGEKEWQGFRGVNKDSVGGGGEIFINFLPPPL